MYSYHCSNVVVRNVTILAPHDSPNTDGVDPGMLFELILFMLLSENYCYIIKMVVSVALSDIMLISITGAHVLIISMTAILLATLTCPVLKLLNYRLCASCRFKL